MKLKNRIISLVLLLTILLSSLSLSVMSDELSFSDAKKGQWFYDSVKFVCDNGYMNGVGGGKFAPNDGLTRAMFVTLLGRMAGVTESKPDTFKDTNKNTWYSKYIGWAVEVGVVTGFSDGTFKPDGLLTREQMAAAFARYIESLNINMPRENSAPVRFNDEDKIAGWASEFVEVLRISGIVAGDSKVNYNPKANVTRAESATIIMNFIKQKNKAWQGYMPDINGGYAVFGSKYLYSEGTILGGTLGSELEEVDSSPALHVFKDENAEFMYDTIYRTDRYFIGLLINNIADADIFKTPYLKVCFKYDGDINKIFTACFGEYGCGEIKRTDIPVVEIENDNGWRCAYVDLSSIKEVLYEDSENGIRAYEYIDLEPYTEADSKDNFYIKYLGLFSDINTLKSTNSSNEEISDYLNNYYIYSDIKYTELTDALNSGYLTTIRNRINQVLNSDDEITPEMIEKNGGKCYYFSSTKGDDSVPVDELSPEHPWKSPEKLVKYRANNTIITSVAKPGDGVFFERGSVFYPEIYQGACKTAVFMGSGVTYAAYGTGEKPVITSALDFTETPTGNGIWYKTEWDNVWKLEQTLIDENELFRTTKCDIGNIIFNEGQYFGVRIVPNDSSEPFGEGKTTRENSWVSNGMDYFEVKSRDALNPGTALQNNLEFIQDQKTGNLYLYWDGENPAEYFDDIKVSRNGTSMSCLDYRVLNGEEENITIDNIAALYSTDYNIRVSGKDIKVTNCEIGFSNKALDYVASGIECASNVDGWYAYNCYFHEVGDGPISIQCGNYVKDVTWDHCVYTCCGIGIEIRSSMQDGYSEFYDGEDQCMSNVNITDSVFAYLGWGLIQMGMRFTLDGYLIQGAPINTNVKENVNFNNNLIYKHNGRAYTTILYTDKQHRGWNAYNNTYVSAVDTQYYANTYPTIDTYHHYSTKNTVWLPFNLRYLTYLTSHGFSSSDDFYWYEDDLSGSKAKGKNIYFTSSYYIERGIEPEVH